MTNEKVFDETDRLTAVKLTQGVACASAFGVSADDAQPFAAALARACAEDAVARDAVKTSLLHVRAGAEGRFIELEAPDILEHIRRDLERPIAQSSSVALQQLYVAIETLDTFVHGTRPRGAATLLVR